MNQEIINIEELRNMAQPIIEIPGFDAGQVLKIRVQRPNIMTLLIQGKVPNHLMSTVSKMIVGQSSHEKSKQNKSDRAKEIAELYELYCEICMVKPTYQQMKDVITDEQMERIFVWATQEVKKLDSFRKDEEDGASNNDGKEIPQETK